MGHRTGKGQFSFPKTVQTATQLHAGVDEAPTIIKIARRNINTLKICR